MSGLSHEVGNEGLSALLLVELQSFANKLGITELKPGSINFAQATTVLTYVERLSRRAVTDDELQLGLLILGLLWEHRDLEWDRLWEAESLLLSRLGLLPSARMVDPNFGDTDQYTSPSSLRTKLSIAREISDKSVVFFGVNHVFSKFQYRLWKALDQTRRLGVSAPTSSGKSYVLIRNTLAKLKDNGGDAVFVVPTNALINQVAASFRQLIKMYSIEGLSVHQSIGPLDHHAGKGQRVFVLTQERVLSGLPRLIEDNSLTVAIFDEIQNLERVANESDDRSRDLLQVLDMINTEIDPDTLVVSGPRIRNIQGLSTSLFGEEAQSVSEELPPVVNITYAFEGKGKKISLRLFAPPAKESPAITIAEELSDTIGHLGGLQITDRYLRGLNEITHGLRNDDSTVIFAGTRQAAVKIAVALSETPIESSSLESLSDYLSRTVSPEYSLSETVRSGIAYHHATVPAHVRHTIESAYSMGSLKTIVCTTTLMQGVNLPAKYVVARSPALSGKQKGPKLTGYEFANLRGRAGRLMQDFVGRTLVLDQSSFEDQQIDLFEYPEKDIATGYQDRYEDHKDGILEYLENETPVDEIDKELVNIVTYIRQTIIRHGTEAEERLKRVGIELSTTTIRSLLSALTERGPKVELCIANPHWDPIILRRVQDIVEANQIMVVPSDPFTPGWTKTLVKIVESLKEIADIYVDKYLSNSNTHYLWKLMKIAQGWASEAPLSEVIAWKERIDDQEVDSVLKIVNSDVPFGLPRLLRPVVMCQDNDNPLLTLVEWGAFHPITKAMLDLGIGRELSISIRSLLPTYMLDPSPEEAEQTALNAITYTLHKLNRWEVAQLKYLGLV